jgi:hypothetical protein
MSKTSMRVKTVIKTVRVMWDGGKGLRWRRAFVCVTPDGQQIGHPQATPKLARALAEGGAR